VNEAGYLNAISGAKTGQSCCNVESEISTHGFGRLAGCAIGDRGELSLGDF
jgi:hypothetical protein